MDLFSITCTTCKSRLKVRDEAAIGQILACPKCGGMVMVRRPDPALAEAVHAQDSQATVTSTLEMTGLSPDRTLGDSAFADVEELLADAPPRVRSHVTPDPAGGARPRFVGAPPAPAPPPQESQDDRAAAALAAAAAATLAPPPPGETDSPSLPPPDWAAPQPSRYWMAMGISLVVGAVLAFGVVSAAIHLLRDKTQPGLPTKTMAGAPATDDPQSGALDEPVEITPRPNDVSAVPQHADNPADPASPVNVDPAQNAPQPPAGHDTDPIGIADDPGPKPEPTPPNPNDPLAKFDRLIGGEDDPLARPDPPADPHAPIPAVDTTPPRPAVPRPPPREVNVAARLADPLPGIQTSGTPLADFLQLLSDLSTIPITLEPDALPFARATADTPVVLQASNTSVGGALTAALKSLGLEHVTQDDHLVVRLIEPTPRPLLTHVVGDLTGGDEAQLAELVELVETLVEPGTWGEGDDAGSIEMDAAKQSLVIRHRRAVQAQTLVVLEKLRTARGLTSVVRLDPAYFRLDTRSSRAHARLETPVSLNFRQPTRLVAILAQLGQAGGVRILVDWRDAAEADWNPDAEATLVADKQPLHEALDALLLPLDLDWRIVDGRTIQVTTPERLARRLELEVYKVGDLLEDDPEGERLISDVRTALGEAAFEPGGAVLFDAEGQCLLASLPQPKHRELESRLGQWRSERGK